MYVSHFTVEDIRARIISVDIRKTQRHDGANADFDSPYNLDIPEEHDWQNRKDKVSRGGDGYKIMALVFQKCQ